MSNEKLEALMWRATSLGLRWGAKAHEYGSMREEYAEGWARMHNGQITAARAIGVEEADAKFSDQLSELSLALHDEKMEHEKTRHYLKEAKAENKRLREDAPVEERHRRAAAEGMVMLMPELAIDADEARWIENGGERAPHSFRIAAQVAANAERDGRASRDAEVAELRAYRRALEQMRNRNILYNLRNDALDRILSEELARKGTP